MRLSHFKLSLFLFIATCFSGFGQIKKSALFIGNSYTYANNLPEMIVKVAASQNNEFKYQSSTPGGYLWATHSTDSNSTKKIDAGNYDYLILQEQSTRLADTEYGLSKYFHNSFPAAEYLNHRSKLSDICHKTMFYLTWGRKEGHGIYQFPFYQGANYGEMQDNLTLNYSQLADLLNAEIAPVGEAWRQVSLQHPEIELYTGDGSHPSAAGSYLAACVFYTAIFQEQMASPWKPDQINQATADILSNTATNILLNFWDKWNIKTNISTCLSEGLNHNNQDWYTTELDPRHSFYGSHFTDDNHGYIKGDNLSLWQTINGGSSWNQINLPSYNPVESNDKYTFDAFYLNKDTAWFAVGGDEIDSSSLVFTGIQGNAGKFKAHVKIFRSVDGGQSWEERSPDRQIHEILDSALLSKRSFFSGIHLHFDSPLKGTLMCDYTNSEDTSMYTFWTEDGGLNWMLNKSAVGKIGQKLWFQDGKTAFKSGFKDKANVATLPQKFYKTEDQGMSWQTVASFTDSCCEIPFYNIGHDISSFIQISPDTLLLTNSLFAPNVYRSVNGGGDWDSIGTIGIIGKLEEIITLPNGVLLAATSGRFGRIMASYDKGENWVLEAFFPYSVNSLFATENYIYALGTRGTIHRKKTSLVSLPASVSNSLDFNLFPNPSPGQTFITGTLANAKIRIYSNSGALLKEFTTDKTGSAAFSLEGFPFGIYMVEVSKASSIATKKFILNKE